MKTPKRKGQKGDAIVTPHIVRLILLICLILGMAVLVVVWIWGIGGEDLMNVVNAFFGKSGETACEDYNSEDDAEENCKGTTGCWWCLDCKEGKTSARWQAATSQRPAHGLCINAPTEKECYYTCSIQCGSSCDLSGGCGPGMGCNPDTCECETKHCCQTRQPIVGETYGCYCMTAEACEQSGMDTGPECFSDQGGYCRDAGGNIIETTLECTPREG